MDIASDNYVDSGIIYMVDTTLQQSTNLLSKLSEKPVRHKPWSPEWLNHILHSAQMPRAVGHLRAWMLNWREQEAMDQMVLAIRELNNDDAITTIKSLKRNKKFVRGTKGQDLKLSIIIENIENNNQITANGLLDSGATGSCINRDFVEQYNLPV